MDFGFEKLDVGPGGAKAVAIRRAMEIARKISVMEELVVQLILQDHVHREKLNFTVSVSKGLKAS